jgi:hypothetical protein
MYVTEFVTSAWNVHWCWRTTLSAAVLSKVVFSSLGEQLQEVVSTARPKLNSGETRELEKLINEFQYICTVKNNGSRHSNRVYHRIGTRDVHPICQSPCILPWAKQTQVHKILQGMKGWE